MIVVTRKAAPTIVAAVALPRAMYTVDAVAKAGGLLLFWQTSTKCRAGDALPADAVAFKGEAVTIIDPATGAPVVVGTTAVPVAPAGTGIRTAKTDAAGLVTYDYSDMKWTSPPRIHHIGNDNTDLSVNPTLVSIGASKAVYQYRRMAIVAAALQGLSLSGVTVTWEAVQRV